VDVTIGAGNGVWVSGGNPAAIMTTGSFAQLAIAAGKTLTCRGDFVFNTTQNSDTFGLTMASGSTFQFDSSTTSPTTTAYSFRPANNGVYGCKIIANGTQANPCAITSVAGGANGIFTSGGFGDFGTLQDGLTYTNCYLGEGFTNGGQTNTQGAFTKNLVRAIVRDAPQLTAQAVQNCLWIGDHNETNPNMFQNGLKAQVFDGMVYEYTNNAGNGCSFILVAAPTTAGTVYEIKNSLCLPNAAGENSCSILSMDGSFGDGIVSVRNNTGTMMGRCISIDETGDNNTGVLSLVANNIAYAALAREASDTFIVDAGHTSSGLSPVDNVSPANIQTNNLFGSYLEGYPARPWYANQANGYGAAFSSTPGLTDLHVDPKFKDSNRNMPLFDSKYLGHVAGSTWASHASTDTFTVGDIVSNDNPIYYNGAVINFRCIQPHVKYTTGSEPGGDFSSNWRDYWEFASLYSIRTNLTGGAAGAGNTITDPSLGLSDADYISAALAWIRDGYAPTNPALKAAGYDGSDIGAVPVQASAIGMGNFLMMGMG
jgi:hypothetical protein